MVYWYPTPTGILVPYPYWYTDTLTLTHMHACDLTVCGWYVKHLTELSVVQHSLYILFVNRFQLPVFT